MVWLPPNGPIPKPEVEPCSDDLAGVEDPGRVEGTLDGGVEGQDVGSDLGGEAGLLEQADAVFAADGPAEGDGGGDDVVEGGLRPEAAVVVTGGDDEEGMEVAVSGVGDVGDRHRSEERRVGKEWRSRWWP